MMAGCRVKGWGRWSMVVVRDVAIVHQGCGEAIGNVRSLGFSVWLTHTESWRVSRYWIVVL